jgi:molybdopterin-guanine dinucleotide biosynthesis protein A
LLELAWRRAEAWSPNIVVGLRSTGQLGELAYPTINDDAHIGGPLASLSAGLSWAAKRGAEALLTIACDTPFLPDDLPHRLAAAIEGAAAAVPVSGGRIHPTCSLWRTTAASSLAAYLATGRRSLEGFADFAGFVPVEWTIEDHDPFANINTPEELAAAQTVLDRRDRPK